MDAVEFLKALERRRNYKRGPNDGHCNWAFIYFDHRSHEELVAEVEQWAKEHPAKTRQSEFLKMFPHVILNDKGQPWVCPRTLDTEYKPVGGCVLDVDICQRCKDKFWGQEVE